MKYFIGCSGFYYQEWKKIFYPEGLAAKNWFRFYCDHFNTIEINSSFYRSPTPASLQKWYAESPPEFVFSIKAPRMITHIKRFRTDKSEIEIFYNLVSSGLKNKLGCVLFQLPPSFSYTPERLQLICEQLNSHFNNVVEFRHQSWWQQEVFNRLRQVKIIFCGQSYPGNIPDNPVINGHIVYYRFHGKPVLYKSQYEEETLKQVLRSLGSGRKKAFIYFNNTWGNAALINSKQMQQLTETQP